MKFLLVGGGYRSQVFRYVAPALGLELVGVVHRTERPDTAAVFTDLPTAVKATQPDFILTVTPWDVTEQVIRYAVAHNIPVMAETPPAPDPASLRKLVGDLAGNPLVQVAEQYPRYPEHAARIAAIKRGVIGEVGQVQVSSTQTYHAVALLRAHLGLTARDLRQVTVRAHTTFAPLVQPLSRQGWTDDSDAQPAETTLAVIDFTDQKSGVYDMTTNQTRNLLRSRRLLARGTIGEISDLEVTRLAAPRLITTTQIQRRQTGHDLDLNGYMSEYFTLGDDVLWQNQWPQERWNDDELAVASLLAAMQRFVADDGPPPYPLIEAAADTLIGWAIEQAARESQPVTVRL